MASTSRIHRQPRTTQERRAYCDAKDQGLTVRAKRNRNGIPNSWDDIGRERKRNWKSQRKSQYR